MSDKVWTPIFLFSRS